MSHQISQANVVYLGVQGFLSVVLSNIFVLRLKLGVYGLNKRQAPSGAKQAVIAFISMLVGIALFMGSMFLLKLTSWFPMVIPWTGSAVLFMASFRKMMFAIFGPKS